MHGGRRVGAIVLARAGSSRLPGKLLRPFGSSTVCETFLERLAETATLDETVVATTTAPADDALASLAAERGLAVVRGSEADVVGRMVQGLDAFRAAPDVIVRACADNPLVMPTVVDSAVRRLVEGGADLVTPFEQATWPFGYGLVTMTAACLRRIDAEAEHAAHREHVEAYCFDHPERFDVLHQVAPPELCWPELVLTLDHACDLARLERLGAALDGVPLADQPRVLIERLRRARVWVEGHNDGPAEGADLVVRSRPRGGPVSAAPLGTVSVDTVVGVEGERFVLRYVDPLPAGASRAPLWVDRRVRRADDTPERFLAHAVPLVLPHLLAAPARSAAEREPPVVATKSVRPGARRGFGAAGGAEFPRRVVVAAETLAAGAAWIGPLLEEVAQALDCTLLIEGRLDPALADRLASRLGPDRVAAGTGRTDPFAELRIDLEGRPRIGAVTVGEAGFAADGGSLEAAWRGPAARRARAQWLDDQRGRAA